MRLSDFIRNNPDSIEREWEKFAGSLFPASRDVTSLTLRDHIKEILCAIVADMETNQSTGEQSRKSQGAEGGRHQLELVGQVHAKLRIENGFRIGQLIAEYRALRASILRLWSEQSQENRLDEVTRFNESIDEALTEATNRYVETMNRYRDLFLGILGHDLRNPLGAILGSATLLAMSAAGDDKTLRSATRIMNSANRMNRMIKDLLDLTRAQLGRGIPIKPAPMDLNPVCWQVIEELEAINPDRKLQFEPKGDLHGEWDADRLAQLLSNLIANADEHGYKDQPIRVAACVQGEEVLLEVHNQGEAISDRAMANLFEPITRHRTQREEFSSGLGLGLFIAREIVTAHSGKLTVKSNAKEGTTFTVRLPRRSQPSTNEQGPGP